MLRLKLAVCVAIAIIAALGLSLIVFLTIAIGPFYWMMASVGRQGVADAPAHGGVIFFVTIPLALMTTLFIGPIAGFYFFRWLKPSN